jgi:aryl-phospho-beta-D-glucosidase BglC (GH1 family)
MAIDIFNEPWNYTWEQWKTLAENAFKAIDSVNSDILIMVEGIGAELDDGTKVANGDEALNPNWGENLFSFKEAPLDIPKDRLILSPHTYGPSVFVQRQFMDPSQPECEGLEGDEAGDQKCNIVIDAAKLRQGWEEHFGYLAGQGYAIVVGEFGGRMDWPQGAPVRDQDRWGYITDDVDRQWQNALVDYMIEKNIQGCYWSINPESGDADGLYGHQYDPVSATAMWGTWTSIQSEKMSLLKRLWGN